MTLHHIQVRLNGRMICWCAQGLFLETQELAVEAAEKHSVEKHQRKSAAVDIEQLDGTYTHIGWCGDADCKIHRGIQTSNYVPDDPRCPRCGIHASDHDDIEVTCRG